MHTYGEMRRRHNLAIAWRTIRIVVLVVMVIVLLKEGAFLINSMRIEHQREIIAEQMNSENGDVRHAAWKRALNWNLYIADAKAAAQEPFVGLFVSDRWLGVKYLPDYRR